MMITAWCVAQSLTGGVAVNDCAFCNKLIDYHEIIECITSALDAKDPYTAGHSQRVSDIALKICRLMGLPEDIAEKIHLAAHLHDIGKIGIPDAILNKEGKLDDREWEIIKRHPQIGANILSKSVHLAEMKDMILYHHERFDGRGYPAGLKGTRIPLGARIIAICDSIDAMTSSRAYRKAYSLEYCYLEIEKNLGKMYDPDIGGFVLEHWQDKDDYMSNSLYLLSVHRFA
jgi:putative nucleotidyltransferase with HDIG domain